jgi:outer membrane protein, heavy metal efflux system
MASDKCPMWRACELLTLLAAMARSLRKAPVLVSCLGIFLVATGPARADPAPGVVLTRSAAARLGAERAPAVLEARAPIAAHGAVRDAASAPVPYAPRVNLFAGRRTGAFGSGLEIGGSATQDISLHGLGGARRDVSAGISRAGVAELDRARLAGVAAAILAWLALLEAQELLGLRAAARKDAEEIARVADARVDRGVALPVESSLAAAELGAAELAERDAEGMLFEARASLKLATGLAQATEVRAAGTLEVSDPTSEPPGQRREHPAAIAARSQIALAQADARLARASAAPALGVGVTYSREATGERLFTGTLSLPLPVLDPSRFDEARQAANVLTAEARAVRVRDELAHDLAVTSHERTHTREVRETLRTRVLVPLRETVRLARAAYRAGTQDATGLLVLRQRLIAAEEQLAHASAEILRADVRSALARGTLLDEAGR